MNSEFLFERDMLYPTDNYNEPGSVHIKVSSPNKNIRIPVIIESKTAHSPVRHLDSILRIMQSDIFDRIFIDIKKSVDLFIKTTPELADEYGKKAYIHVAFDGERPVFTGADAID
jgi:hypothetical protein